MAPRRHPLLLLSALALVLASFAIAPRPAMAATHTIKVDTLLDLSIADAAGQPYCELPAPEPPQGNCSLRQAIERPIACRMRIRRLLALSISPMKLWQERRL